MKHLFRDFQGQIGTWKGAGGPKCWDADKTGNLRIIGNMTWYPEAPGAWLDFSHGNKHGRVYLDKIKINI